MGYEGIYTRETNTAMILSAGHSRRPFNARRTKTY